MGDWCGWNGETGSSASGPITKFKKTFFSQAYTFLRNGPITVETIFLDRKYEFSEFVILHY